MIISRPCIKQYHYCHQGNINVTDYVDEFQESRVRSDLEESGSQEVLRFISWLREPLGSKVDVRNVPTFLKPVNLTLRYEAQL